MEIESNTKVLFIDFASSKDDLCNLPQNIEYLIVRVLVLDAPLNLPYGLKEFHVKRIFRDKSCIEGILFFNDDEEDEEIKEELNYKLPFGCKLNFIHSYTLPDPFELLSSTWTTAYDIIRTEITKEDIEQYTMFLCCSKLFKSIANNKPFEYKQAIKVHCKFRKNKKQFRYYIEKCYN